MPDSETLPEFLQRLNVLKYRLRRPGRKIAAGHELYLVDLSDWKLCFTDRTPIIWVNAEAAEQLPTPELAQILQDVAREQGWRHRECIILLDGDGQELEVQTAQQYFPRFVIVDAANQRQILGARSFIGAFLNHICNQIPISDLAPYEISKPVTRNRFFGRETEIRKVIRKSETNFALIGPRRIGKTSLLHEIEFRLKAHTDKVSPYIFLDCSVIKTPYAFVESLVQELQPSDLPRLSYQTLEVFLVGFLDRMHKVFGEPITIFLDEVDRWFAPASRDRQLLDMVRASSECEDCRYIVAGFSELMREPQRADSPFYKKTFEQIEVGTFKRKDVADLVLTPMRHLRIQFEQADEVVGQIYKETNGIPLLVQYYCLSLINRLDSVEEHRITPDSLSWIRENHEFKTLVLGSFWNSADVEERCLVYGVLSMIPEERDMEWLTQREMYIALTERGLSISPEEIDQICDRLILSGILTKEGSNYRFSIPLFPKTLRVRGLDYLFSEAQKEMGL